MDEERNEVPWTAALKVETWVGELRVNVIRLVAIVAFYGHHLVDRYILKHEVPPGYTAIVTAIALAWAVGALGLHIALTNHWMPDALRFAAVGFDTILATSLLLLSDGPRSPLVALLFLVIATSPLRVDLRVVWTATLLALLSYAFVCGHAKWKRPDWQVPRRQQVIVALSLSAAGFLAGQSARQARRLAQDYAERVRPEEPA